jgi:hypothetical protein
VILQAWGRLEEALALHKKQEALCLELGNKDGLQASYGNQALNLQPGRAGCFLESAPRKAPEDRTRDFFIRIPRRIALGRSG